MSTTSFSNWDVFIVVLQWACSTATDITPQSPGNPDHPNVRRTSTTPSSPTIL